MKRKSFLQSLTAVITLPTWVRGLAQTQSTPHPVPKINYDDKTVTQRFLKANFYTPSLYDYDNSYPSAFIELLEQHKIAQEGYDDFLKEIQCPIITPFSTQYDLARLSDKFMSKPLLIVYCFSTADVTRSVQFARKYNIPISVRAGGHNTAGYASLDNRMLIDVANIKGIIVDPIEKLATVGAGVRLGEYSYATSIYGLFSPVGDCKFVGITGFTLGGGISCLSLLYGLGCDALQEVGLVTANGDFVVANNEHNSELFWAHQGGGGGSFGIVTYLKIKLVALADECFLFVWEYSIDDAADVLFAIQEQMLKPDYDNALYMHLILKNKANPNKPEKLIPVFIIAGVYIGNNRLAAKKALGPILATGTPNYPSETVLKQKDWEDMINMRTTYAIHEGLGYLENIIFSDHQRHPIKELDLKELKRSSFVNKPLSKNDFKAITTYFKNIALKNHSFQPLIEFECLGGTVNKVPRTATAFVHRDAIFDVYTDVFWGGKDPHASEIEKEAVEWLDGFYESNDTKHIWSNESYQNYQYPGYTDWETRYFAENYPRLQEIKRKWDPDNIFNAPQSIKP
ncbi:MAG: FAD-dependent oxidoreductase [Phycisphaerales bacterium]|nr:FAD-dependent oxidoreductase [Phycisphaerales bacterium]